VLLRFLQVGLHVGLMQLVSFLQVLLELLFSVPATAGYLTHFTRGFGSRRRGDIGFGLLVFSGTSNIGRLFFAHVRIVPQ
jgi:hypothetical protein